MLKKLKLKLMAIMIAFLAIPMTSCAQSRLLSTLPSGDGVEKIYIGSALIKLGSQIAVMSSPDVRKYSDLIKEVKSVEVYNCDNRGKLKAVRSEFDKLRKTSKCEELMLAEDGDEISAIYTFTTPGESTPGGLIIFNDDKDDISIVVIHGAIDLEKLASAAKL